MEGKSKNKLIFYNASIIKQQAVNEIIKCNKITKKFGLTLTNRQAAELIETRNYVLNANGRIEFGGGVVDKIIKEFCDSPFISMYNYTEVLHDLVEMFYEYKNETLDLASDEELIKYMKKAFDGVCHGSIYLLSERELAKMARNIRFGIHPDDSEDNDEVNEKMEDDFDEY
ncbi:DUF6323 family protein [Anaerovorax sp. IOR16]|uniref:DUF6323 family protein n=1 Tax=Anaerovorax sp. IOR16 TaxID=2773458 RepID=UPI0019D061E7|nr:DUF6323 family protein [Anaerovorax sp. IOR16]